MGPLTRMARALATIILFTGAVPAADRTTSEPRKAWPSGVVLVVDSDTMRELAQEVEAWREAAEANGWATWLVSDSWTRCEDVRDAIITLARATPGIEGAMLVGNVPYARVSGVRHLVSAETRGWIDLRLEPDDGLIGDAYFADFDLAFDAVDATADANRVQRFRSAAESAVRIERELFVSRVDPGKAAKERGDADEDPRERLRRFFVKAAHAHREARALHHVLAVGAEGEASDALESWVLFAHEALPSLSAPGRALVNLAAETGKRNSLDSGRARPERQRALLALANPDLDLVVWRSSRLANGARAGSVITAHSACRVVLREAPAINDRAATVWSDWQLFGNGAAVAAADGFASNSDTATALAWFGLGATIGQVARASTAFESGLYGDPTFAFGSGALSRPSASTFDMTAQDEDMLEQLSSVTSPSVLRAAAITELGLRNRAHGKSVQIQSLLLQSVKREASPMVRLAALTALARERVEALAVVLPDTLRDPAEPVRAASAMLMGEVGRSHYVAPLLRTYLRDPSPFVVERARDALLAFDLTLLKNGVDDLVMSITDSASTPGIVDLMNALVERAQLQVVPHQSALEAEPGHPEARLAAIRYFRDHRVHRALPLLLATANASERDPATRRAAIDALAGYAHSSRRESVISALRAIAAADDAPAAVRTSAEVGVRRLIAGPNAALEP